MAIQVQLRRGTATQNNAFTGAVGELSFDTTANQVRIHDGSTAGGFKIGVGNFPVGTNNVAVGNTPLDSLDSGSPGGNNTAVGHDALTANTTASDNTAVGKDALKTNSTGANNTAVGDGALLANSTAASSTAVGASALTASTGTLNTAIGFDSGQLITSGTKNTIVGSFDGNQGGLDIRTSDSHIVLSDGDGNPRLIIDDGGNVDIGGETTVLKLKNTTHEDTDGGRESKITFQGEQSGGEQSFLAQIQASHDGAADDQKGDLIFRTNDGSDGTSPTEAMRIQSDQTILAGSPTTDDDQTFQVIKTGASSTLGIHSNRASVGGSALILSHNRNTSVGSFTALNDNDQLGRITFQGSDGADIKTEGAQIHAEINGTVGSNDLPTDLVFSTTADGASSITERMRILESGGITFNGDTATANALNDFETGTWTATTSVGSGSITLDNSFKTGIYQKVGNMVFINLHLRTSAVSSPSAGVLIGGIPFNTPNDIKYRFSLPSCTHFSMTNMDASDNIMPHISSNVDYISIFCQNGNNITSSVGDRFTASSEFYITGSYMVS